jgi:hypothetical protein
MTTFDYEDAKEDLMTIRSTRLVAYLVPLLVLGSGVSFASSGPAIVAAGNPALAAFCPTDSSFANRRATRTSTSYRIAQFGHCRCSHWDANNHCDGQTCN